MRGGREEVMKEGRKGERKERRDEEGIEDGRKEWRGRVTE
jgi:hypothetical protein